MWTACKQYPIVVPGRKFNKKRRPECRLVQTCGCLCAGYGQILWDGVRTDAAKQRGSNCKLAGRWTGGACTLRDDNVDHVSCAFCSFFRHQCDLFGWHWCCRNAVGRMFVGLGSDLTFAYIDRTAWFTAANVLTGVVSLDTSPVFPLQPIRNTAHRLFVSSHSLHALHCVVPRQGMGVGIVADYTLLFPTAAIVGTTYPFVLPLISRSTLRNDVLPPYARNRVCVWNALG